MERGHPQNFVNNTLSEVKFQERHTPSPTKQIKETNLALRNTTPHNSFKS